jgi:hypothetical protein
MVDGKKKSKHRMVPSSDLFRSSSAALALSYYYKATEPAVTHMGHMFKVSFPEEYEEYRTAFAAGRFVTDDPGPWLGRAIVHKLQVLPHRDNLDKTCRPAGAFNVGYYVGGDLYLTDLKVKLR